ncbi:MAG: hypothetical protein JKY19_13570 [Alcanivoracaceae bacterium]|nr:hypothetical protein [Alcanivoracaceae bacterium]
MHQKKPVLIFATLSLLMIGLLPIANYIKDSENINIENMFNTDILESYRNYFFFKILNRSLVNNNVIVGQDDFLFLGNKHNYIISKTQNIYPNNPKGIEKWVNNLAHLQQWYEDKGIKFIMAIVPNKHTLYSDKLPGWVSRKKQNVTDEIVKLSNRKNLNLLDLRKILLANKQTSNELLYFKTDSHWNALGASIGYREIINYLNKRYQQKYQIPEYTFVMRNSGGKGLSRLLKTNDLIPSDLERQVSYRFKVNYEICQGNIDKETSEPKSCQISNNTAFNIHKGSQYSINQHALNSDSVLFLCDSFSMQNSRLFNATFNTIWEFHYNLLLGGNLSSFVDKQQPRIVIYQVVERSLYNNYFINEKLNN